jgi:hypothetical protein
MNKKLRVMKTPCFTILLLIFFLKAERIFADEQPLQGQRMPRLTTDQRDQISVNDNLSANGLFIYNTDNDCVEYWNGNKWISLCGDSDKLKSEVAIDCENIMSFGRYERRVSLNSSNYLVVVVNVVKT